MRTSQVLFPVGVAGLVVVFALQQRAHQEEVGTLRVRLGKLDEKVGEGRRGPPPEEGTDPAEVAKRIDADFRAEPVDAAWEAEARPRLEASVAVAEAATSASVRSMACHGTMCRLDLVYADPRQLHAFVNVMHDPKVKPWNGPMFTHVEPRQGQRLAATSYLLREGLRIPYLTAKD
jgi:hypothetical protein